MAIQELTYTGSGCTMVVLVNDEMLGKYRQQQEGVSAGQVVDSFEIYKFDSGKQGNMSRPSKAELDNVFGTNKTDDVIEIMLQKGQLHATGKKGKAKEDSNANAHSRLHVERSGRPL